MAWSHADQVSTIVGTSTSTTVTYPLAVNAGDLLVAIIRTADTAPTAGRISDNINGNWSQTSTTNNITIGYFLNSGSAGANGLTLTVTAATSGTIRIAADRFTGGPAATTLISSATHALGGNLTGGDCGTIFGDPGGSLLYGGGGTGANSETLTAGSSNGVSGTIGVQQNSATRGTVWSEYVLSTTAGTQTFTWTISPTTGSGTGTNCWEATFGLVPAVPSLWTSPPGLISPTSTLINVIEPADAGQSGLAPVLPTPYIPRFGINRVPSIRPWDYDGNGTNGWNPDAWFNKNQPTGWYTTIGKANVDQDFAIHEFLGSIGNLLVRIEIPWRIIEQPSQGVYDWSHLDYVVTACFKHDLQVLAAIWGTPNWIGAANTVPAPDQFQSFVTQCVNRYKNWGILPGGALWGVRMWEMWNEPYVASGHYLFNAITNANAQSYVNNILNPGYTAVKTSDPNGLVVSAGIGGSATDASNWIIALNSGNAPKFDYHGFHDYPASGALVNSDYNTAETQFKTTFPSAQPMWIGEFGNQDTSGSTIVTFLNAVMPPGSQTDTPGNISFYNARDDYVCNCGSTTVSPETTLTSGLTNGTPVTSISIGGIGVNLATTFFASVTYAPGDGTIHSQSCGALTSSYTANGTSLAVSFTPNYSYPAGTQVCIEADVTRSPQAYGLMLRDGTFKGDADRTFRGYTYFADPTATRLTAVARSSSW